MKLGKPPYIPPEGLAIPVGSRGEKAGEDLLFFYKIKKILVPDLELIVLCNLLQALLFKKGDVLVHQLAGTSVGMLALIIVDIKN
jgi:hypothetical protein